ncbi:HIRA-interacting protein 5 [Nadsonia fulvescens var. elongata DSM 6958]|uniref:HIRA-interacting protein 5 n=1 Tax=Nadsonia fulvescens var. elongata DSM 6958 TaxID=857566 RepID=A0A1E3PNA0_9ASCO|nr:HIRA-interacting protein 5 [Nadsonia fulvescens var. elongata DSM 6958]
MYRFTNSVATTRSFSSFNRGVLPTMRVNTRVFQGSNFAFNRLMHIKTTTTPNEDALKFLPSHILIPNNETNSTMEFLDRSSAIHSPLAEKLFSIPGVKTVLIGTDFITVEKDVDMDWPQLKQEVFSLLSEHLTSGQPIVNADYHASQTKVKEIYNEEDEEVVEMIKELIETRIRPAIQEDGGDIDFVGFDSESGMVSLCLRGACRTCESSEVTLKNGIESMLMHYIEEVQGVKQVLGPEEEKNLDQFNKLEKKLKEKHPDDEF